MSKGTVLYIGGFELPDKNAAAHRVISNAKALRDSGWTVVLVGVEKAPKRFNTILQTRTVVQGFECYSVPYPTSSRNWFEYLTSISPVTELIKRYNDVIAVVAYNYQAIALLRLKNWCRQSGIKLIADCTEWYSSRGRGVIFSIVKGVDTFLRMRVIQKRLDGIIVISRYLERYYRKCHNLLLVPPLIDIEEDKWNRACLSSNKDKIIRFTYTGSPGKSKDRLDLFISSLGDVAGSIDFNFIVIGITKDEYCLDHPEQASVIEELSEKISFLGRLSHRESLDAVKKSDWTILIRDETRVTKAGFPTKFVESIGCGVPVIATDSSDLAEYFADSRLGIMVPIGVENGLAMAIVEASSRSSLTDKVGASVIPRALFDYREYACSLNTMLESL